MKEGECKRNLRINSIRLASLICHRGNDFIPLRNLLFIVLITK